MCKLFHNLFYYYYYYWISLYVYNARETLVAYMTSRESLVCLLVFPSEKNVIERYRIGIPICDVGTFQVPIRKKACRTHHYKSLTSRVQRWN